MTLVCARNSIHPPCSNTERRARVSVGESVSSMHAIRFVARTYGEFSVVKNSYYLQPGNFHFLQYFRVISISAKSSFFLSLSPLPSFFFPPYSRHPHPSNDLTARLSIIAKYNIYIYIYIVSQRERHILGEKSWEILGDRLADPLFIVDWNSKTATPRRGISLKLWLGYWNAAQVRAWRLVYGTWIDSARSLSWHASTRGMYTCSHTRAFVTAPLYNAGLSQRFAVPFRNRWTDIATSL